jgi:hypothetical protein
MTDTQSSSQLQIEVTLTIDGDWQSDPLRVISGIREGARNLDEWEQKAVAVAREQGRSWEEIGAACGVTRQAAWERFSRD